MMHVTPVTPQAQQLPLLFDYAESQARADTGTQQALSSAIALPWSVLAQQWLAGRDHRFTSEDLVAAIGLPSGAVGANRNNAVGALIRTWSRRHQIMRVGYQPSLRVESHGALLSVWERASSAHTLKEASR